MTLYGEWSTSCHNKRSHYGITLIYEDSREQNGERVAKGMIFNGGLLSVSLQRIIILHGYNGGR